MYSEYSLGKIFTLVASGVARLPCNGGGGEREEHIDIFE